MTAPLASHMKFRQGFVICANQAGLTIVELMISITLGFLIVLSATALLVASKNAYVGQDEATQVQDAGRFGLEMVTRAVRQASFENWETPNEDAPIKTGSGMSANLAGLDGSTFVSDTGVAIESPSTSATKVVNGSDVLAVRFFGSGAAGHPDGTIINCGGYGVSQPTSQATAEEERGWSIFYVKASPTSKELELRCKYFSEKNGTWNSDAIVRGVESFQVLYGVDTDSGTDKCNFKNAAYDPQVCHVPNKYLTATQINVLDDLVTASLTSTTEPEMTNEFNAKTNWKKVKAVKVAMLVRGTANARADVFDRQYDLFGKDYSAANGAADKGVLIKEADMTTSANRIRKVFLTTIQVRGQSEGGGK